MFVAKNWAEFQHYKERRPAWIKLHRSLLDDYDFQCLHVASRALAPMMWLLASEYENGEIPLTVPQIAFRLRMSEDSLREALGPLIEKGFFIVSGLLNEPASNMLAECKRDASPEIERREEERENKRETEERGNAREPRASFPPFQHFWELYPNKIGKEKARKAWPTA